MIFYEGHSLFLQYKYQINIDGTVAAYRLPYLLAGDGVVFKQDSEYYEHFYDRLKPWVHYIPLKHDLSDLEQKLKWAADHDKDAKEISRNAQKFTWENLLPHHIICYHGLLFEEYSKLLTSKPTESVLQDMELVQEPNDPCHCMRQSTGAKHNEL